MRSQKMLRSWQKCDFARDIPKKCQVLNILCDAILAATDRFHEQLLKNIRLTTGSLGGRPNLFFEKLLMKTVRSIEDSVTKDVENLALC